MNSKTFKYFIIGQVVILVTALCFSIGFEIPFWGAWAGVFYICIGMTTCKKAGIFKALVGVSFMVILPVVAIGNFGVMLSILMQSVCLSVMSKRA